MNQMSNINLQLAASLSISFGISELPKPVEALIKSIPRPQVPPIVYLKGKTCTGCSISLINYTKQSTTKLIINHENLMMPNGIISPNDLAVELIDRYISGKLGPYFLALEGFIPQKSSQCYMANRPLTDWINRAGKTMLTGLAVGSCAIFGNAGLKKAEHCENSGLKDYFEKTKTDKKVYNIPGCPVNSDTVRSAIIQLATANVADISLGKEKFKHSKNKVIIS
jgi:hydrogenase small subunit